MRTWAALLRGINVGGRNRILMADLRARFEDDGYRDVRTYIQSGNVIFGSDEPERETLRTAIERMLADAFDYDATIELRDRRELDAVIDAAPKTFGADDLHSDVLFLLPPLQPEDVLDALKLREGVDTAWAGPAVVYVTRVKEQASKSGLSKYVSHPYYRRTTIRNWNTTRKLLALMTEG